MKLYKVLLNEKGRLISPYQGMEYVLGKKYKCHDFNPDPRNICSRGFYATGIDGLPFAFRPGRIVVECEVWGKQVECNQYKRRYEFIEAQRIIYSEELKALALAAEKNIGYKLHEVLFPISPLSLPARKTISIDEIKLLKSWAKVRIDSFTLMKNHVWDCVWCGIGVKIEEAIIDNFHPNITNQILSTKSVKDITLAYVFSLFPYDSSKENPFQVGVDLWQAGLIPLYGADGTWRLHTGEKAEVIHEWKEEGRCGF